MDMYPIAKTPMIIECYTTPLAKTCMTVTS
jgi:hypothetical protein